MNKTFVSSFLKKGRFNQYINFREIEKLRLENSSFLGVFNLTNTMSSGNYAYDYSVNNILNKIRKYMPEDFCIFREINGAIPVDSSFYFPVFQYVAIDLNLFCFCVLMQNIEKFSLHTEDMEIARLVHSEITENLDSFLLNLFSEKAFPYICRKLNYSDFGAESLLDIIEKPTLVNDVELLSLLSSPSGFSC